MKISEIQARFPAGSTFGKYIIEEMVGYGGTGVVFRAVEPLRERQVAIKVLSPQFNDSPDTVERFFREVRALSRLRHPNVIEVYDYGTEKDIHYFAMEFLEGKDLTHFTVKTVQDFKRLAGWIAQCARALDYAYENGEVIHRDLKPANIFLTEDDRPRVMDFGTARLNSPNQNHITMAGEVLGTPAYMAPEQALDSRVVSHQSDVYSLGATLYFLTTGRPPFYGSSPRDVMVKVLTTQPPRPRVLNKTIPEDLEAIVLKAMDPIASKRYETAGAFAADLEAFSGGDKPSQILAAAPPRQRRSLRWLWVALAIALTLALGSALAPHLNRPRWPPLPTPELERRAREEPEDPSASTSASSFFNGLTAAAMAYPQYKSTLTFHSAPELRAILDRAGAALATGQIDEARELSGEAQDLFPDNARSHLFLARCLAASGKREEPLYLLTALLINRTNDRKPHPGDPKFKESRSERFRDEALLTRGRIFAAQNTWAFDALALRDFQDVTGSLKSRALIAAADVQITGGRFAEALALLEPAISDVESRLTFSPQVLTEAEAARGYATLSLLQLKNNRPIEDAARSVERGLALAEEAPTLKLLQTLADRIAGEIKRRQNTDQ